MGNVNIKDKSINKYFYIELVDKLEQMYGKAKTYGEVTLMGELIGLLNSKTQMEEQFKNTLLQIKED